METASRAQAGGGHGSACPLRRHTRMPRTGTWLCLSPPAPAKWQPLRSFPAAFLPLATPYIIEPAPPGRLLMPARSLTRRRGQAEPCPHPAWVPGCRLSVPARSLTRRRGQAEPCPPPAWVPGYRLSMPARSLTRRRGQAEPCPHPAWSGSHPAPIPACIRERAASAPRTNSCLHSAFCILHSALCLLPSSTLPVPARPSGTNPCSL
jgi:hypothetical protein